MDNQANKVSLLKQQTATFGDKSKVEAKQADDESISSGNESNSGTGHF
jgi:hypothetical protein